MGADLRHNQDLIALALQRFSEAFFAQAVVIFPGVVEEINAMMDRLGHDFIGRLVGLGGAEMITSKPHC